MKKSKTPDNAIRHFYSQVKQSARSHNAPLKMSSF